MISLDAIIESLIFVSKVPLSQAKLIELLPEFGSKAVRESLVTLLTRYNYDHEFGFYLEHVAGGYQFRTKVKHQEYINRLFKQKPRVLAPAAGEVLSIVSYCQPITKAEIEHLRGADAASQLKTLMSHNLIKIVGKKEDVGRPNLYGTTKKFLEVYGLGSIKKLPKLKELAEPLSEAMPLPEAKQPQPVDLGFEGTQEN